MKKKVSTLLLICMSLLLFGCGIGGPDKIEKVIEVESNDYVPGETYKGVNAFDALVSYMCDNYPEQIYAWNDHSDNFLQGNYKRPVTKFTCPSEDVSNEVKEGVAIYAKAIIVDCMSISDANVYTFESMSAEERKQILESVNAYEPLIAYNYILKPNTDGLFFPYTQKNIISYLDAAGFNTNDADSFQNCYSDEDWYNFAYNFSANIITSKKEEDVIISRNLPEYLDDEGYSDEIIEKVLGDIKYDEWLAKK